MPADALHAALDRLTTQGWPGVLTAGYGPERFARSRELAERWPLIRRAVGLHPEHLAELTEPQREQVFVQMEAELAHPSVVALGEIGLDKRYKLPMPLALQLTWFERGLLTATTHKLPVVLHIVGWHGHALDLLRRLGVPHGGAVHRWSGPLEMLKDFENLGLGISMSLEPRETPEKRQALAEQVRADRLLVETDWPFLRMDYAAAVEKMQEMAEKIAQWRQVPLDVLREQVEANARRLYHLEP